MYYDEDFIKSLPDDYRAAILRILEEYAGLYRQYKEFSQGYDVIRETAAFLSSYVAREDVATVVPRMTGNARIDTEVFNQYVNRLTDEMSATQEVVCKSVHFA